MQVAAIDIGSNSTRLLVARVEDYKLRVVHSSLTTTRLGAGVEATGKLSPQAMASTLSAVEKFVQQSVALGASQITIAATSAVRDATNQRDFVTQIYQATGHQLVILTGEQEAELSYLGVLAGLPEQESQVLVVDVGGGSTETSWQQENQIKRVSVNVGAVRATEGHYHPAQINALLSPALKAVPRDIKTAIAVGGTATTVAAMLQQMTVYQPEKIHLFPVTSTELQELGQQVNRLTLAERRQLPGLQPARADIIPAGITIISAALEILKISSFIVSEADILWGMALMAAVNVDKKSGLGLP